MSYLTQRLRGGAFFAGLISNRAHPSPTLLSMTDTANIQAATLERFLAGWKKFTPQSWTELWSEDFVQQMLPFTLGVPPQSRAQALARLTKLMETLKNYQVVTHIGSAPLPL